MTARRLLFDKLTDTGTCKIHFDPNREHQIGIGRKLSPYPVIFYV